ncbi:MAG: hypothetical protein HY929_03450 [Euryarchaeota archaeon]|nr:hypothetical protein [Euryarchaeota archaeon]
MPDVKITEMHLPKCEPEHKILRGISGYLWDNAGEALKELIKLGHAKSEIKAGVKHYWLNHEKIHEGDSLLGF